MAKLVWRVKLVTERHPGVVTETELACIKRDVDVGLADLGLRLDEGDAGASLPLCAAGRGAKPCAT